MFTEINLNALPDDVSREEREYFEYFKNDINNPAKRHRIPLRGEVNNKIVEGFFEEPLESALMSALSELLPIYTRSQVSPSCQCKKTYFKAQNTLVNLQTCTTTFQFTDVALQAIKKEPSVTRAVLQRLKDVRGQVFFTRLDVQEHILTILVDVLEPEQIEAAGLAIVKHLKTLGISENVRLKRIEEQQKILDKFFDNVPSRPYPPTQYPCVFCQLPHKYSFVEWIPSELPAISRAIELLVGVHVPITEIPRVIEALEMWVFAADTGLFSKKNKIQTMTGAAMSQLLSLAQKIRGEVIENLGSFDGATSNETDSSLSVLDGPPPSTPNTLPADK